MPHNRLCTYHRYIYPGQMTASMHVSSSMNKIIQLALDALLYYRNEVVDEIRSVATIKQPLLVKSGENKLFLSLFYVTNTVNSGLDSLAGTCICFEGMKKLYLVFTNIISYFVV